MLLRQVDAAAALGLVFEKAITPEVFARLAEDAASLRPDDQ
jgi:hypothetical protein